MNFCKYFKCFDEKGVPNGLLFGFNLKSSVKDNPKVELCVLQSCFGHLDAVLYLLNNGFKFVGNYIGCDLCSYKAKKCAGSGKIWRTGNIYIGACRECGFINIMEPYSFKK